MAGNRNSARAGEPRLAAGERWRRVVVSVRGIVQGVGFRPRVHQLATACGLQGWVRNRSSGVELEVAGPGAAVAAFLDDLQRQAPPLASIIEVKVTERPYRPLAAFHIEASTRESQRRTLISPDVRTCDDCLRELADPADRRYRYPFINCTNCGPRYTIIRDVPYDRDQTTMAGFALCPECRREYDDPGNRRFHAQPNACPRCGPRVWLERPDGRIEAEQDLAIRRAVELLTAGAIVAARGLGGFHLATTATDEAAVRRLRGRKIREDKPFAVMFESLEEIQRHCRVNARERDLLLSRQRPIVLLERRPEPAAAAAIAPSVAPGNRSLGAFLPYTPLHRLLFEDSRCRALVMTSGNQSDEPIVTDNDQARDRLRAIADWLLLHDRPIHIRCDDSVVRVVGGVSRPLRRARGYVPAPVLLAHGGPSVLAVGAELKSTVCLSRGREAFLSQHIGDLENLETLRAFEFTIEHLERLFDIRPQLIVHDLHPDYLSSQWAEHQPLPRLAVQHHHAHIAAVLAESQFERPVLGLALDGTGYGTDGTIWGGEVLKVDPAAGTEFERLARLLPLPLPGGSRAIREPWRMAVSALVTLDPPHPTATYPDFFARWPTAAAAVLVQMIRNGINSPLTSSCGRLFDAVSALIGLRERIHYEGQAAIELEQAITVESGAYRGRLDHVDGLQVINPLPILTELIADIRAGVAVGVMAARFHNGLVDLLAEAMQALRDQTGIDTAALSGGVFQNAYLAERLEAALHRLGFQVLVHREVPPNDACIALGQAYLGIRHLAGTQGKDR